MRVRIVPEQTMMAQSIEQSRRFILFLFIITMVALSSGQVCTDVDITCVYDRSARGDNTVYCLRSGRQSHLSPNQIGHCPLSLEMVAIFSSFSLPPSSSSNQSLFVATNGTRLKVICDEGRIRKEISGPSKAIEILAKNLIMPSSCDCIERGAAAWSLGAIIPSEYAYKCGADQYEDAVVAYGTNVTTRLCNREDVNSCLFGVWRVELRWTTGDNIDLILILPADRVRGSPFCDNRGGVSAEKTCPGSFSSITNGRWVATLGPDDLSGIDDDSGFESATFVIENGPPSGSNFLVYVYKSSPPFDVDFTLKYFFNGAEVGSVVPNLDAPSANENAWGSSQVPLDILELTFNTDPNTFLRT